MLCSTPGFSIMMNLMGATEEDRVWMADPAHPGEVLRDDLAALGWTQCEAARNLGCSRQSLGAVLNGKARLSAKLALALEAGGIGKAHMWMAMQSAYDLAQARAAA